MILVPLPSGVLVVHRFHNKMASGKERNANDNPDSSDKCINLSRERVTDYPIPQYGAYDPHVYFPPPPQHHGFRPYQTNYLRRPGGYPPASQPLPGYSFPSYSDPIIIGGDHGWGEYREGEDSISKHRTEKNVDDDSEGSMKIEDRKGQLRWNATMDEILFNILGEAAREGKKSGKKWDTAVWNDLIAALSEKTIEKVKSSHIENRLRQMRKEYVNFMALRGKSGVSYDRIKQMIVAPQGFWDDILSNSANEKKYKAFRERGPKWDLEKLCTVIGDSHATGSYALGGLDKVERMDDLPGPDESIDLDDDTISSASTKNTKLKRQHGKKTRAVDEVKEMLQGVTDHLEKLRETVDPLSFGRTLREAVMGVVGFDQKSKNTAFKLLMKNRQDAEFFVLTDEEGRKDMFIDMGIE